MYASGFKIPTLLQLIGLLIHMGGLPEPSTMQGRYK